MRTIFNSISKRSCVPRPSSLSQGIATTVAEIAAILKSIRSSLWSGRVDNKPRERLYHRCMRHHVRHALEPPIGVVLVAHRLIRDLWAADLAPAL
jgi:hypothetical protein